MRHYPMDTDDLLTATWTLNEPQKELWDRLHQIHATTDQDDMRQYAGGLIRGFALAAGDPDVCLLFDWLVQQELGIDDLQAVRALMEKQL